MIIVKKRTKEYYTAPNLFNLLLKQTHDYQSTIKPIFWKEFKNFSSLKLFSTSSKGNSLKSLASNLFQVWTYIISKLDTDLQPDIEKNIMKVLKDTEAFYAAKTLFIDFISEACYEQEICLKENFFVKRNVVKDRDKSIYSQSFMAKLEHHARLIEIHTQKAISDPYYANMWLYVLMHLSNIWRKSDLIFKLIPIAPKNFGINDLSWFKTSYLDKTRSQKILNYYTHIMERQKISKTGADLRYIFDPTTVQAVATALVICSFHQINNTKEYLLFTFLTEYDTITERNSRHIKYFDLQPDLKKFQNRKMNRTVATYLFNIDESSSKNQSNLRLKIIQLARGHKNINSISHYAMNSSSIDSNFHDPSFNICTTGEFGWTYSLIYSTILADINQSQTNEQRLQSINYLKNKFEISELEGLGKFYEKYNNRKVKSLLKFLFDLNYDDRLSLFLNILKGNMPSKLKFGQCLRYPNCTLIDRSHCFGCEFFVPQYLVLIEAVKELRRLSTNIKKEVFVLCALRDAKYASDICQLIDEARNCFDSGLIAAFISSEEQEMIENEIKRKKIQEIN